MKTPSRKQLPAIDAAPAPAGARGRVASAAELDVRRIKRALSQRQRYRYVKPVVLAAADGYRI